MINGICRQYTEKAVFVRDEMSRERPDRLEDVDGGEPPRLGVCCPWGSEGAGGSELKTGQRHLTSGGAVQAISLALVLNSGTVHDRASHASPHLRDSIKQTRIIRDKIWKIAILDSVHSSEY